MTEIICPAFLPDSAHMRSNAAFPIRHHGIPTQIESLYLSDKEYPPCCACSKYDRESDFPYTHHERMADVPIDPA